MRWTCLQLQSFAVIVVDNEADASVLVVRHSQRHHAQHLHVLQAAIATARQRDLLLHAQVYAGEEKARKKQASQATAMKTVQSGDGRGESERVAEVIFTY